MNQIILVFKFYYNLWGILEKSNYFFLNFIENLIHYNLSVEKVYNIITHLQS